MISFYRLVIDAIENRRADYLAKWAREVVDDKISTVNMLGCHDGIPLLDLKGCFRRTIFARL